jgi:4-amino-4-deoxy-L-arabinose transferase-like glycosyltransferase
MFNTLFSSAGRQGAPGPGLPRGLDPREAMTNRWDLVAVTSIVAGAIVRIVWGLLVHPPLDYLYSDMDGYVGRAQRLVTGAAQVRYDAFFPPGTHALLAAPMTLFGTDRAGLWAGAVLWCALSAAIPFFAWRLARLLLSPAAAALTALLCASWPLYITYGGYFTSETPSLAFLLASLWTGYLAARLSGRKAIWLGLVAGLLGGVAIANRPQLILNIAVLALSLFRPRRQAPVLGAIVIGTAVVLAGAVLHNSAAADKPTGLSENAGLNFWIGHCDVHDVTTTVPARHLTFKISNPVYTQLEQGRSYYFRGHLMWDQAFFYKLGLGCIERDGLGHVSLLARSILNMSATTIPWPQVDEGGQWGPVRVSNLAYSLLLPFVVVYAAFVVVRRRVSGQSAGVVVMLLQLACVLVVAIFFFGDPRVRSTYDVFGLALFAACITDLFGIDVGRRKPVE